MACPHLSYRESDADHDFDTERAYCTVVGRFVQPMRADVCNERYGLSPAADCEFYRDHHGLAWDESGAEAPGGGDDSKRSGTENSGAEES
ncbi:hypothetical protein RYH80_00070 [Halobaculum sp. MBLA0147]|uniref:hypothetical protein n=1 Tax=Halobaculum sp. MBLA0147 TaxID=3079934 RepID=UPI00352696D0